MKSTYNNACGVCMYNKFRFESEIFVLAENEINEKSQLVFG